MQRNSGNKRREFGGKSKNHGDRRNFKHDKLHKRQVPNKNQNVQTSKREIEGVIKLAGRKGGFVLPEGYTDEVRIDPAFLGTALHNDEVRVLLHKPHFAKASRGGEQELTGEVIKILTRAKSRFVGTIANGKFVPDDRRFYLEVELAKEGGAEAADQKVLVEITDWHSFPIRGRVVEILGKQGEHETEMLSILAATGIVYDFPTLVEAEAKEVAARLRQGFDEVRRDMRSTLTFTIDPASAKDFDDALSFKEFGSGKYEIGVHIADVSHFVRPGTKLDDEARRRANSVYMVDRTVPMLPEVLSADICSLVPNQDRLTYSAIFVIDKTGKVESEWFGRTIIHSQRRFTYEEAAKILKDKSGQYAEELMILNEIAQNLHKERVRKGSVIFEKDEIKVELDAQSKPVRIYVKERLATHKLIEEFMLLANKHVARYLYLGVGKLGGAAVYRIHDVPDKDRIVLVKSFLKSLGYKFEGDPKKFGAREINELFAQIKGEDIEMLVQTAVLRSMAKAIYSTRNIGHFGLGFEFYTHFTSPIRRYPDVLVHRLLTKYLSGKPIEKSEVIEFERIARYSSEREREAEAAERESVKYKQVEYMLSLKEKDPTRLYDGTIVGVTEWGIFVEEQSAKSEGMLRLSSLGDDYYEFDEKKFAIIGKRTKKVYRLGDKIKVKLLEVDVPRHQITWELV
ncbi:MAG TPA: ribonuclease R [Candidatus Paceibacterota bacterium]